MFDKMKDLGSVILGRMTPDGPKDDYEEDDSGSFLKELASELIRAVHAKDDAGVCSCLEAFASHLQTMDEAQDAQS